MENNLPRTQRCFMPCLAQHKIIAERVERGEDAIQMIIPFTSVRKPFGWCSNMSHHPIEHLGKTWRTSEHLFQALRFAEDSPVREMIRKEKSPMKAKEIAKARTEMMSVEMMSEEDLDNMRLCIRLKAEQHKDLLEELLESKSARIIEDVTKRGSQGNNLFWGAWLVGTEWQGKNMLGELWMELREIKKKEHEQSA